jgi:predicted glycogen debranching enzyme
MEDNDIYSNIQVEFTAEKLVDYDFSSHAEWVVSNGIGGYACGTYSGANTRRYHGLLVAALKPPAERYVFLSRVEEEMRFDGQVYELASNQYPGVLYPQGFRMLERAHLYPFPSFRFRPHPDVLLEKRIWMERGGNTVHVGYWLLESPGVVKLKLIPLTCYKNFHDEMHPEPWVGPYLETADEGVQVTFKEQTIPLRLNASGMTMENAGYWHYQIEHQEERKRGFDWHEDLYCPVHFSAFLQQGGSCILTATLETDFIAPLEAMSLEENRKRAFINNSDICDAFTNRLSLAADTFVLEKDQQGEKKQTEKIPTLKRSTILAGYPWFGDWGRDTMISIPGLCLTAGRRDTARDILFSYASYLNQGMLPNRFPDTGEEPEYNTVDGALWFFQALRAYFRYGAKGKSAFSFLDEGEPFEIERDDQDILKQLWPSLVEMLHWHTAGTRWGIRMDPDDNLLMAGADGLQLTWMDARVDGRVITPRIGKPVEINALWINALHLMAQFALSVGDEESEYEELANNAVRSFGAKFVRSDANGLYDVITSDGADASIRPNQIFAVSLPFCILDNAVCKNVVDLVQRELLTSCGLRTLSPADSGYIGRYAGSPQQRDASYHQGTVWAWLLGPFALAHYRVYRDAARALAFFDHFKSSMEEKWAGNIPEVFDGDMPHSPGGCFAQAWSVGETLRAYSILSHLHIMGESGSMMDT